MNKTIASTDHRFEALFSMLGALVLRMRIDIDRPNSKFFICFDDQGDIDEIVSEITQEKEAQVLSVMRCYPTGWERLESKQRIQFLAENANKVILMIEDKQFENSAAGLQEIEAFNKARGLTANK